MNPTGGDAAIRTITKLFGVRLAVIGALTIAVSTVLPFAEPLTAPGIRDNTMFSAAAGFSS